MPGDSAAIDDAMVARLTGDPQLQALIPAGPFFDVAGKGYTGFTLLSVHENVSIGQFGGQAFERTVYQAKAVDLNTSSTNARQAAARIHALLEWEDGPPPLTIAGFDLLALRRVERVRYTEPDAANPDARWQNQGGLYEVITAPVAP